MTLDKFIPLVFIKDIKNIPERHILGKIFLWMQEIITFGVGIFSRKS